MFEFFGGRLILCLIYVGNLFVLAFSFMCPVMLECGLTFAGLYLWDSYKV